MYKKNLDGYVKVFVFEGFGFRLQFALLLNRIAGHFLAFGN